MAFLDEVFEVARVAKLKKDVEIARCLQRLVESDDVRVSLRELAQDGDLLADGISRFSHFDDFAGVEGAV